MKTLIIHPAPNPLHKSSRSKPQVHQLNENTTGNQALQAHFPEFYDLGYR